MMNFTYISKHFLILIFFIGLLFHLMNCCPLPLAAGDWYSSSRGTWTLSSDSQNISNFKADFSVTTQTSSLACESAGSTETQYILHTNFEIFVGVFIDVYTCLDIRSTDSPYRFLYYIVTPTDVATGEQFTSDKASACSNTGYDTARNVQVIISKSNVLNATVNCPDVILGNYSVSFVQTESSKVNGSFMDSCTDTTVLQFSNTDTTLKHAFSAQNKLYCLYSEEKGGEYFVHTFNNETEDQANEIYNFACWVIAYSLTGVTGSAFPESCQQEQSATAVPYGGQTYEFTPYVTCPLNVPGPPGFPAWAIVLIVLGALLLLILIVTFVAFLIFNRKRWKGEDEEGIMKGEEKRQPSPDSITGEKDKAKAKEDGYDSGFDERWKTPVRQILTEREPTMDLVEVTRDEKLKDTPREPLQGPSEIQRQTEKFKDGGKLKKEQEKLKPVQKSKVISPREKKELEKRKQEEKEKEEKQKQEKQKEEKQKEEKQKEEKQKEENKKEEKHREEKREEEKRKEEKQKEAEKTKEKSETPEPEPPPGKKTIQPITPRPTADDTVLARVKKDDKKDKKKDKKEQGVRVEETIKEEPEESSSEYETDESERKARMERLLEKRRRLAEAEYIPPDLSDAIVVGRKKRRKQRELDEMTKKLVSREKQEEMDKAMRERKKAMKRLARSKFKPSTDGEDSSDTQTENETWVKGKRSKYRKVGDPKALEAPYIEQYCVKKDIEEELDAVDYWHLNPHSSPNFADDELELDVDKKPSPILHVQPVAETTFVEGATDKRLDLITQEEGDVWDLDKGVPLPGALGFVGVELGPNGEVPEGFRKDDEGNVIRIADGAMISSGDIARKIELRRRLIFSLPRLIRNTEGRPLGGYKDDEYGPTAEWDYGVVTDDAEGEEDGDKKGRRSEGALSAGRQVGFTDDRSIPSTPLQDPDENQKKGRHLTAAERELLKKRLFEDNKGGKENVGPDGQMHVYFVGDKGGIKPNSLYIDNAQIQRQGDLKPVNFQRSKSLRANMVMKSDAYDDGRAHLLRDGLSKDKKILENADMRRSLRQTRWTPREGIPEEENATTARRTVGSDDEFILVPGSLKKLPRPSDLMGERLNSDMCPRYERHKYVPGRELSDMSMRTADTRPFSGNDRRLRQCLEEFYKDKKYFDYYLDTEDLPTNATVETRDLATHGRDFLLDVAEYWGERQPPPLPPRQRTDLALRLPRIPTLLTAADSGNDSMRSYTTDRPHTADDIQNMPVPPPRSHGNRPSRENTLDSARETLPTARTERTQLSDIVSYQSENE